MYTKLNKSQLDEKIEFKKKYIQSKNHSIGTQIDPNANVENKNVSTLANAINKDIFVQVNRREMFDRLKSMYNVRTANDYLRMIKNHEIYVHDETYIHPYCASINMYPFLTDGLKKLGGSSSAPNHLSSFCGGFINMCYISSSELAGAIATVEFLMYFTKFFIDDYGTDFDKHKKTIEDHFAQVVYSLNQPAGARGFQSIFWNISIFDKYYYESMFHDFYFPSGETKQVKYEHLEIIQKMFMKWFNNERKHALLTFPVVTAALLNDGEGSVKDKKYADFIAEEMSEGNSFFVYQSASADSLSSCCRLRNELADNDFSYSLGAGGVATGSIKVITLNINRLVQLNRNIKLAVQKVHKFLIAYRSLVQDYIDHDMIHIYKAKLITLDKQFLTIGINGMIESAEFKGIVPRANTPENAQKYKNHVDSILGVVYKENIKIAKETGFKFNTEFVPAENLGVKNAKWDQSDGFQTLRDCYNSYFYAVEDTNVTPLEKFKLHGKEFTSKLDGGSALHLNLNELLDKEQALKLLDLASATGCYYWCYNVPVTICEDCGYIHKQPLETCARCSSENVGHATRVIGYLRPVKCFSKGRQEEHSDRYYATA